MQQDNPSTSSSGSRIFIDVRGNPLRVFTETSSVQARPKVVRMLRAGGATITHNPKDSQIILVDSATEAGVALAAIWLDKPVLDAAWAYQANNRGVYAGADEDWGGYRVPGNDADDEEMPLPATSAKSPLPSPRRTPVEDQATSYSLPSGRPLPSSRVLSSQTSYQSHITSVLPHAHIHSNPLLAQSHNIEDLAAIVQTLSSASALTVWQTILEVARRGGAQNPGRSSDTQAEHSHDPSRASSSSHIQGRSDEGTSNVSKSHNASVSASSTSRPRQQSRHSRTPSPVSLSLSRSKGKRRELPIDCRHKRQKLNTPGIDTSSSDSSTPPPPLSSSTRRDRQIFKTNSGQPLVFVVQAGMRNRKELADTIKNHGGKLGAEIPQADYIVLAHNMDYFKDLLTATVAAGKPAVQAAYVYECARQGVLLDEVDFSFDGFEVRGKRRGRSFTVDLARLQRANKPKINEGHLAAKEDKTHGSMPLLAGKSPRRRASSGHQPSSSRSPTPPRNVVQFSATRNRYTDEDRAYFSVYVAHLLKGDPDMSLSAITLKLAQKMPHHTRASWLTVSSTHPSMRDEIDELRRNAHKIRREQESLAGTREHDVDMPHSTPTAPALPLQSSSQISGGPNVPLVPTQAQIPEVDLPMQPSKIAGGSNVPQVPSVPTQTQIPEAASDDSAYAEDFELITRALADGCADTRTDQEVWDALTKIQPCRTARTWGEFFDQNENDIYKVVTQTMQQAEDVSVKLER